MEPQLFPGQPPPLSFGLFPPLPLSLFPLLSLALQLFPGQFPPLPFGLFPPLPLELQLFPGQFPPLPLLVGPSFSSLMANVPLVLALCSLLPLARRPGAHELPGQAVGSAATSMISGSSSAARPSRTAC